MIRLVSVKSNAVESNPKYQAAVKAQKEKEKERRKMETEAIIPVQEEEPAPIVSKYPVYIDEIKQIIKEVANKHGLTYKDIIGKSRKAHIVAARYEAIEAVHRARPKLSLNGIGKHFSDRDHSTILYSLKKRGIKYV